MSHCATTFPAKLPLLVERKRPLCNVPFLGSTRPTTQTTARSTRAFLHNIRSLPTDSPTEKNVHATGPLPIRDCSSLYSIFHAATGPSNKSFTLCASARSVAAAGPHSLVEPIVYVVHCQRRSLGYSSLIS